METERPKETEKLLLEEKNNDLFSGMNVNKYASSIKIETPSETSSETVKVSEEKYSPTRPTKSSNHSYNNNHNNNSSISASAPPLYLAPDNNNSLNQDDLNSKMLNYNPEFEYEDDNGNDDNNNDNDMKRYVACGNCHSWLESKVKCDLIVCPICNVVNDCRPSVLTDQEKKATSDGYIFSSIIDQIRECFAGAFTPSSVSSSTP